MTSGQRRFYGVPACVVAVIAIGVAVTQEQKREREQQWADESGSSSIALTGSLIVEGRWQVLSQATISTDAEWQTTKLRLSITKLNNAVGSSAVLVAHVGGSTCKVYRFATVYSHDGSGLLTAGETGYQDLTCSEFIPLSDLRSVTVATIDQQ